MITILFRIDAALKRKFQRRCNENAQTMSAVIVMLIKRWLEE